MGADPLLTEPKEEAQQALWNHPQILKRAVSLITPDLLILMIVGDLIDIVDIVIEILSKVQKGAKH